jgi:transcriptional regulator with XRE-family HTH domain
MSAYERNDTSLLLQVLRAMRGWDQGQFAAAAGVSQGTISRYESGERVKPATLERLVAATGLELRWVESYLLPVLRAARTRAAAAEAQASAGGRRLLALDFLPEGQRDLADAIGGLIDAHFAKLGADIQASESAVQGVPPPPAAADRDEAARAWERLAPCTASERRFLVEECVEFHSWALAERLCHESEQASATAPTVALELAHLAVAVAQLAPGDVSCRQSLLGYVRAHLAHALHLAGDLAAARIEFATAWQLWRDAGANSLPYLKQWRLLLLQASLRSSERNFAAALDLLEQAQAQAPPHALDRILLQRASILEQSGDLDAAVAVMHPAAPHVASGDQPR